VLAEKPDHDAALLALGKLELLEGNAARTLELVRNLPDSGAVGQAARALRAEARFAAAPENETIEALTARVAADPKDLDARFSLALRLAKRGDLDRAAEELLALIAKKRDYQDGEARRTLLDVLELIGTHDPKAEQYRSRLSSLLFA